MKKILVPALMGLVTAVTGCLLLALPVHAQATSAVVVAACGTPPAAYVAGNNRAVTQDTGGRLCNTGSSGSATTPTVTGSIFSQPSANFVRPNNTTAYAVGNLVANSTTAGSVVPLSWTVSRAATTTGWIFKATLTSTNTALVGDTFVLHLYATSPTPTNGDGGAFLTTTSGWLCDITIQMNAYAFTDTVAGQGVPNSSNACMFAPASGSLIYGLISTSTVFTPTASSTWTAILDDQEN